MKKINTLKIALVSAILFSHYAIANPASTETVSKAPIANDLEHKKRNKNLLKGAEVINIGGDGKWPDEDQLHQEQSTCLLGFCFNI